MPHSGPARPRADQPLDREIAAQEPPRFCGAVMDLSLAKPPSSDRESAPNTMYDDLYGKADIATQTIER